MSLRRENNSSIKCSAAEIKSAKVKAGKIDVPRRTEILIIDTPAALHGKKLANYAKISQTIVMPLMPSPMDIRAAEHFIDELFSLRKLINRKIKVATVANRVREDTIAAAQLEDSGKNKTPHRAQATLHYHVASHTELH